jgi:hypothetical protein
MQSLAVALRLTPSQAQSLQPYGCTTGVSISGRWAAPGLSLATRTMAACRELPPHMAAPPDGGHAVTMAHHVGHARCVRGGGILLFFHGQGCRVISSLTHVRVRRFLAPFSRHRGGGYGC